MTGEHEPVATVLGGLLSIGNLIVIAAFLVSMATLAITFMAFMRNEARQRSAAEALRVENDKKRDEAILKALSDRDKVIHDRLDEHRGMIDSFWKRGEISDEFQHQRRHTDTVDESLLRRIEAGGKAHVELSLEVARLHERMNLRDKGDEEVKVILREMQRDITEIAIKQGVKH